jgi:phage protein U
MLALFGEVLFETLTSPEAFRVTSEYRYAEHQVVESAPRLQWLGNGLQKISMELSFHVAFTNPASQMNLLWAAAEDHQARALIFGNGVMRGYFVIEMLEETHRQLADDGSFVAISARIELREWIPGADFAPSAPPRRTTPSPAIVQQFSGAQTGMPVPLQFNPSAPIGPTNLPPASAIVRLSTVGIIGGVTYSPAAYSQPGVSGVVGEGPGGFEPRNFVDVLTSQIVRAG